MYELNFILHVLLFCKMFFLHTYTCLVCPKSCTYKKNLHWPCCVSILYSSVNVDIKFRYKVEKVKQTFTPQQK